MRDQIPLFIEDYHEALRATIQALGGFKRVGSDLKPDLSVEAAGRWLADCCNPDKREKLSLTELAFIRRAARQANCHILAGYELREAGYADPQPVEPEDERAKLERQFIESVRALEVIQQRLARTGLKACA